MNALRNIAEVRAAVEAFMADRTDWTVHAEVSMAVARQLGVQFTAEKYVGLTGEGKTLDGQVRRALTDLAARGVLVGRKHTPMGYHKARLEYLSARQYDVLTRQRMEDAAAEERQRQADQDLLDGFAKLGWTGLGVNPRTHQLTIDRATAGRILNALEMHQRQVVGR